MGTNGEFRKFSLSLLLFADDAALIARSAEDLQILLNILDVYLEKKKMRLNIQKTEIVVFGTNKNNDKFLFKCIELKKSTTSKYLLFVLNNKGNWKDHVKEMVGSGKAVSSAVLRNSN